MAKFKVGDKVRILDVSKIKGAKIEGFETGGIYEFFAYTDNNLGIRNGSEVFPILKKELKYLEKANKPTKNQRIAALEKKSEEMEGNSFHDLERITEMERRLESLEQKVELIKTLENRIGHLEQEIKQRLEVPNEPLITVEDKPKTPNQQRREIIEKAKEFVEKHGEGFLFNTIGNRISTFRIDFFEYYEGRSWCHPSDVFNEHIGKAIALGRALWLDVSEFEQAVQPTEAVMGMAIQNYNGSVEIGIEIIDNRLFLEHANNKIDHYRKGTSNLACFTARIINDTDAQYGGDE